jgi:archaellum component FlaG (FlaF/FlaG flagellin family)
MTAGICLFIAGLLVASFTVGALNTIDKDKK